MKKCPEPTMAHKRLLSEMFSVFLLWIISKGKTHGYELIKKINSEHKMEVVTSAHVYPILKYMLKQGWIEQGTEKTGKRVKKNYTITPEGKDKLMAMKKILSGFKLRKQFFKEMTSA